MDADRQETYESLAALIEHRMLDAALSDDDIRARCRQAEDLGVSAVLVRPSDVEQALRHLDGSRLIVGSVAGWPDGSSTTGAKLYEGRDLLRRGARRIEFVVNAGKLISRQFQYVETELMQIARSCLEERAALTVNLRSELLGPDLRIIVSKICRRVEAHSIGIAAADTISFQPLLRGVLATKCVSGIDSLAEALTAREAGFFAIGTGSPAPILAEWKQRLQEQAAKPGVIS